MTLRALVSNDCGRASCYQPRWWPYAAVFRQTVIASNASSLGKRLQIAHQADRPLVSIPKELVSIKKVGIK